MNGGHVGKAQPGGEEGHRKTVRLTKPVLILCCLWGAGDPRKESDHRPGLQLLNEPLALKLGSQQAQEIQATNLTPHCPLGALQKKALK